MSDLSDESEQPLLQIEIIQLSNLFGNDLEAGQAEWPSSTPIELTQADMEALRTLDIYRIPVDKQHSVFVTAIYRAILDRDPTRQELASGLDMLTSSKDGFRLIADEVTALRNDQIQQHNRHMTEVIDMTIDRIDRWANPMTSLRRK